MSNTVVVTGVGMIPFTKPGANEPYTKMAAHATRIALADAGLTFDRLEQAYVGYAYGDSTSGQRALYEVGMSGLPIFNVNNACSTGSTALFLARQAIANGSADCVLALGFEQMRPGPIDMLFQDRPTPLDRFANAAQELVGHPEMPLALRYFGGAGLAHMKQYGTKLSTFAKIRAKAKGYVRLDQIYVGPSYVDYMKQGSLKIGDYGMTNLRLGYIRDRYELVLFAENLLNSQGITAAAANADVLFMTDGAYRVRPRTVGATFRVQF